MKMKIGTKNHSMELGISKKDTFNHYLAYHEGINGFRKKTYKTKTKLLKIIEEPNEKLFFILIHNNSKKIIKTIQSRCIIFKKNFTFG